MSAINNILELISKLSTKEKADLKAQLLKDSSEVTTTLEQFITTERFAGGRICPVCGSIHVVRNGHRKDGTQNICVVTAKSLLLRLRVLLCQAQRKIYRYGKNISLV